MELYKVLIQFIITFIVIYLVYYFYVISKCKKKKNYAPVEVNLILMRHNINVKKINLYGMIKLVSLITSFVIAVAVTLITTLFENNILSIILGTLLSLVVAMIFYDIIGNIYAKKSKKVVKKK